MMQLIFYMSLNSFAQIFCVTLAFKILVYA